MQKLTILLLMITFPCIGFSGPVKRTQVLLVPKSMMNSMGADAFKEIKKQTPEEKDTKINQHVQCIAERILKHTKDKTGVKQWETVVFRDKAVNAFALPSGKIGVYTGLMKVAENAEQLAAVIGHEVGHVIAQHGNERVSQGFLVQGSMVLLSGALGDKKSTKNKAIMGALGLGAQFGVLLPHSRTHESEADLIGLDLMAKAGFDPRESIQLWKNMGKAGGNQGPEFLSTHPSHKTRIKDLKSKMKKNLKHYERAVQSGKQHNCGKNPLAPKTASSASQPLPSVVVKKTTIAAQPSQPISCQPAPAKDLRHCNFSDQNLDNANFEKANIAGVSFKRASLKKARFDGAQCSRTEFSYIRARGASFERVKCKKAIFNKADLRNTRFHKSDLRQTNFRKANIKQARFRKADLRDSNIHLAKNRDQADFDRVRQ